MLNSIFKKVLPVLWWTMLLLAFATTFWADWDPELYVDQAYSVAPNIIEIVFSNEISEYSLEEDWSSFLVIPYDDTDNEYMIEFKELDTYDKTIMILTLDNNLVDWEEYKVVVLNIEDVYWQNILYWVDSEADFVYTHIETPVVEPNEPITDTPVVEPNEPIVDTPIVEPNEPIIDTPTVEPNKPIVDTPIVEPDVPIIWTPEINPPDTPDNPEIWGVPLNAPDVENQVEVVVKDNDNLPTTWPEHILILMISLITAASLFVYRFKKI